MRETNLEVAVDLVAPGIVEKELLVELDAGLHCGSIGKLVFRGPVEDDGLAEGAGELLLNVVEDAVIVGGLLAVLVVAASGHALVEVVVGKVEVPLVVAEGKVESELGVLVSQDVVV